MSHTFLTARADAGGAAGGADLVIVGVLTAAETLTVAQSAGYQGWNMYCDYYL